MPCGPGKHLISCRKRRVVFWKRKSISYLVIIPLQPWMVRLLNTSNKLYVNIQGMNYSPLCQFLFGHLLRLVLGCLYFVSMCHSSPSIRLPLFNLSLISVMMCLFPKKISTYSLSQIHTKLVIQVYGA